MNEQQQAGAPDGFGNAQTGGHTGPPPGGWGPPPRPDTAVPGPPPQHAAPPPPNYPPGPLPGWGYYPPPPPPRRRHPGRRAVALAAALVLAVGAGIGIDQALRSGNSSNGTSSSTSQVTPTALTPADAVSKAEAGLVIINTTVGYQDARAAGTGIVLSANGEILTNNHVIDGATAIQATDVGNGRTYTATVTGYERNGDLAVLQLKSASGLTTAKLGDSAKVAVGDAVTAIGNAGGTGTPSAAVGNVTALDQSLTASDEATGSSEQLSGMIQVNADVEPGDSGGALVDSTGAVVGIDTAGSQSQGGAQQGPQQGFAIPIDTALPIAHQITASKSSTAVHIGPTAFLGLEVSSGSANGRGGGNGAGNNGGNGSANGSDNGAVMVAGVIAGSPAAQAGITQGDEVTAVDGHTLSGPDSLTDLMVGQTPGKQVSVQWLDTDGTQHSTTLTLATGPAD
ncbi:S1C family serine protease [Kitasatospora sp. NBC_01250]|uniref:S1C family serine protease n=1 Tax=Kitasatospora sp. NBC_01250 TaxID=2903571 RepID=UPI002E32F516|nr:S1C family serine protease [Kitasatospora sp. NBC_01250]